MNDLDTKHQENLERLEELKDIYVAHDKSDKDFQEEQRNFNIMVSKQFERMEPMIKSFENRKIVRSVIDEETKTWYIYAKRSLTIGTMLVGVWAIFKFIFNR